MKAATVEVNFETILNFGKQILGTFESEVVCANENMKFDNIFLKRFKICSIPIRQLQLEK